MRVVSPGRVDPRPGDDVETVLRVVRVVGAGVVLERLDALVAADRPDRAPEEIAEDDDEVGRDSFRAPRRAPRACRRPSRSDCPRRRGSPRSGVRDRRARSRTPPAGSSPPARGRRRSGRRARSSRPRPTPSSATSRRRRHVSDVTPSGSASVASSPSRRSHSLMRIPPSSRFAPWSERTKTTVSSSACSSSFAISPSTWRW